MNFENGNIKKKLLQQAIAATQHEAGLKLLLAQNTRLDVADYKDLHFTVGVKLWVQQANLGVLINEIKQLPEKGMLVADYVNPKMAEKLREADVPFIDTVGNAYINEKPLYIFIKGLKNRVQNTVNQRTRGKYVCGRAFQPTGLKILYAFMRYPELVNAPYRDIAHITGVALGTVGLVINDLKQGGYLVEYEKKHRQLKNKKQLLDKWVDAYLEKLRPKLYLGIFTAENEYWWKELDEGILKYGARWGGEVAAAKLTRQLKPEEIIVYLPNDGGSEEYDKRLLADNRFRQDPNGNILLYLAFWKTDNKVGLNLTDMVEPVIAYADLLATGDPRNLETARILYDKELAGLVREN